MGLATESSMAGKPISDGVLDQKTIIQEHVGSSPNKDIPYISLSGFQVSHGEYFAHLFEPSITFNKEKVAVNAACLRKLPDATYVWYLVNPTEKKLAIKPCAEDTKDSFRWCSLDADGKPRPKAVSCKIFYGKVMKLMGWDPSCRYKILGKLKRDNDGYLFVFDLTSGERFEKRGVKVRNKNDMGTANSTILGDRDDVFGIPVEEHQGNELAEIFEDDGVFRLDMSEEKEDKNSVKPDDDKEILDVLEKDEDGEQLLVGKGEIAESIKEASDTDE